MFRTGRPRWVRWTDSILLTYLRWPQNCGKEGLRKYERFKFQYDPLKIALGTEDSASLTDGKLNLIRRIANGQRILHEGVKPQSKQAALSSDSANAREKKAN